MIELRTKQPNKNKHLSL